MKIKNAQQALTALAYEHNLAAKLTEVRLKSHENKLTLSTVHQMILDDIFALYNLAEEVRACAEETSPF